MPRSTGPRAALIYQHATDRRDWVIADALDQVGRGARATDGVAPDGGAHAAMARDEGHFGTQRQPAALVSIRGRRSGLPSERLTPCVDRAGTMQAMNPRVLTATVSHRGQTNLPAAMRHRWGIDQGGEVAIVDLGDAALILPGGAEAARAELRRVLLSGAYEHGVDAIADPDLADQ